ncbi:hypothetical protein [Pseudoalteromonas rubra]|uniref:hypothetical protein n=1 Tax=Pseudoalteromonas rubra TaxID=43658 RepID=UPI000A7354F8|nr:hypothetical protein [Pseudoalteromonas rubra]
MGKKFILIAGFLPWINAIFFTALCADFPYFSPKETPAAFVLKGKKHYFTQLCVWLR